MHHTAELSDQSFRRKFPTDGGVLRLLMMSSEPVREAGDADATAPRDVNEATAGEHVEDGTPVVLVEEGGTVGMGHSRSADADVVTEVTEVDAAPSTPSLQHPRKKRIRFNHDWDVLLLKSVVLCDAHIADHGQSQRKFEDALQMFVNTAPKSKLDERMHPTWKTLYERFKKLLADHRAETRQNTAASGIEENRTEKHVLLDDIVHMVDAHAETKRAERNERTEADKRLQAAGERIRAAAVQRASERAREGEDGIPSNTSRTESPPTTPKVRRREVPDSDEEESAWLRSQVAAKSSADDKRLKLDEERLALEREANANRERAERQRTAWEERQFTLQERRLALDENRLELDRQRSDMERDDRRGQLEERKRVLDVLAALATKLG